MNKISPNDLVNINKLQSEHPLRVDLAYAREDNILLEQAIYHPDAELWLHKNLAAIAIEAARLYHEKTGGKLVLYDGLRTVEAQEAMLHTKRVRDNPHWLEGPRLLSPPGSGAHPRAMAIDVSLEDADGAMLDMGTDFDFLAETSAPEANPAHRDHPNLSAGVKDNRALLDEAMFTAAKKCGVSLVGLPEEWWDYRFPSEIYEAYEPLKETDLPPVMRLRPAPHSASDSAGQAM